MFNIRTVDLTKLNSITKYPSIPTYHPMGERGILKNEPPVSLSGKELIVTEKVDGTNGRIIILPDLTYLIGSREELLYYSSDLLAHDSQGIVTALKPVADKLVARCAISYNVHARNPVLCTPDSSSISTFYLEVYGGRLPAATHYTSSKATNALMFDHYQISLTDFDQKAILTPEQISLWRDNAGQAFTHSLELSALSQFVTLGLVPRLCTLTQLPQTLEGVHSFITTLGKTTRCGLDAVGLCEGYVVRTPDRSTIVKLRFEDYQRTLRKSKK